MGVILVGIDGLCFCNCGTKCLVGKCGSAHRCSKEQLEERGYTVMQVDDSKSSRAVHAAMTNDGKVHKLKIRDVSK